MKQQFRTLPDRFEIAPRQCFRDEQRGHKPRRERPRVEIVGNVVFIHAAGGDDVEKGQGAEDGLDECGPDAGGGEEFLQLRPGAMGAEHFRGGVRAGHHGHPQSGGLGDDLLIHDRGDENTRPGLDRLSSLLDRQDRPRPDDQTIAFGEVLNVLEYVRTRHGEFDDPKTARHGRLHRRGHGFGDRGTKNRAGALGSKQFKKCFRVHDDPSVLAFFTSVEDTEEMSSLA